MRTRYGNITLEKRLRPSKSEDLNEQQMRDLYQSVGLEYTVIEDAPKKDKSRFKANKNKNTSVYKGKSAADKPRR